MKIPRFNLPLTIIFIGILFSLCLQALVPNDVFYSGDGGLKALLAQQFSAGKLHFDLRLPANNWIKNLWDGGLYPFRPPFVYNVESRYFITFPFTFPLITAPFHALFGFRGLYVIPLLSTWALWLSFYSACRRLKLGRTITAIALVLLIFAAPLSLYSGMYWEHTLAVALAFQGLAIALVPPAQGLSTRDAIVSGSLIGLSVWFRPEFLCLVGITFFWLCATQIKGLQDLKIISDKAAAFAVSMLLMTALFFSLNLLIYQHPLGIHSVQIVEEFSLKERLTEAFSNFKQLLFSLSYYFPIVFFSLIYVCLALVNGKLKLTGKMQVILLVSTLFVLAVPLIVPAGAGGKQWGPRFLLITVPLVSLLAAMQLKLLLQTYQRKLQLALLGLFAVFLTTGLYINSYLGAVDLARNYQVILPAVKGLRSQPDPMIAMSHEYVAQALAPSLPDKTFFLTEDSQAVKHLGGTLLTQGYKKFLYVCYPHRDCNTPQTSPDNLKFSQANQRFTLQFSDLGKLGKYPIYEVSIMQSSSDADAPSNQV
ncbi:dolichol-phosphate mannosyltransferase [Trichocoleus sp. FACHB-591]|uniref:LA_3751/LA_3752 family putative glycosyltransferase n=1 Tax=Trichocoleus sp. FACHB-591 TaxID=2692872 RepID=UPI001683FBCB|nr:dolichol-phosphate mannosyltransferase [Trichocoleus sp. FACHB-591]MBD2097824.1 dolichol-phosphate mannosyltransferase [Trichocoleus sp. FACHB-591]